MIEKGVKHKLRQSKLRPVSLSIKMSIITASLEDIMAKFLENIDNFMEETTISRT